MEPEVFSPLILDFKIPRWILACSVGAMLAQAGAVTQAIYRNPLAEPSIIGVSSGAALGAAIASICLPLSWSLWSIPLFAFLGGLILSFSVYGMARHQGQTSVMILVLSGIVVSLFVQAFISLISYIGQESSIRQFHFWQMGTLVDRDLGLVGANLILCILCTMFFKSRAQVLDIMLLGDAHARYLGVDVEKVKMHCMLVVVCATALTVATCGFIGFVGLIVPHFIRLLFGVSHHKLILYSAYVGSLLLSLADLLADHILYPAQLPVGLVTAVIGTPLFLFLLYQNKKVWSVPC
tara:strand:- start:3434 stop:4315 length:882 start_codon:yes stop_codon:yes gene_type:complete